MVVLQGGTSSCGAGIILSGRELINSAPHRDIFNLSGILFGKRGILAYASSPFGRFWGLSTCRDQEGIAIWKEYQKLELEV